jgi:hypothetical protein
MRIAITITAFGLILSAAATPADDVAQLPAMNFSCSLARDEMFDAVKANAIFGKLDKELYGSPVTLRITHSLQPTAGGKAAGLLSAVLTGGTLGLIPAVTNNNLIVRYDVRVQGHDIASYSYSRTFTRAVNVWAEDKTYGLGDDGLAWLKGTAKQFAEDAGHDPKVVELQREYAFYYGS